MFNFVANMSSIRKNILILFLFVSTHQLFAQLIVVANPQKYYTEKIQRYLDKDNALSGYYRIDNNGISMYASANAKENNQVEFSVHWKELNSLRSKLGMLSSTEFKQLYVSGTYNSKKNYKQSKRLNSLKGCRIALDPGHVASDYTMAELEKKHILMPPDSSKGIYDSIELSEGMLTSAVAQLLKKSLEKEGAIVMLTRTGDETAFGKTYWQWKKDDYDRAVDSLYTVGELSQKQHQYFSGPNASDRDIFRVIFRDLELAKRAECINSFQAQLCVIIHFNVDEFNTDWNKPSDKDFNMCFIGGAFQRNDLLKLEQRCEFFRMLISDDLEQSMLLSAATIQAFQHYLKVPIAGIQDAEYLKKECLPTAQNGVFCRNLQLTRYVHAPLVYGESLYQDNLNECRLLNDKSDKTQNERIRQIAKAYQEAILNYLFIN